MPEFLACADFLAAVAAQLGQKICQRPLNTGLMESHINADTSLRLIYNRLSGSVVAGTTADFGSFANAVPESATVIGVFLTPLANVHISMTYYNGHIYAYSETYTGRVYYDFLLIYNQ